MEFEEKEKEQGVMDNMGTVAYTDQSFAYVNFERISACGDSCASCSKGCKASQHLVKVYNSLGAKKGDRVEVAMDGGDFLKMTFLLYGVPLIVLVLAAVGLELLFTDSIIPPLASVIICVASFFLINALVKRGSDERKTPVKMRKVMRDLNNM